MVARRQDRLADVLADCRTTSPDSVMWAADLADGITASRLALQAWHAMGGIDVLVNNAAVPKVTPVPRLNPAVVEEVMQVNFHSPVRMTLRALPGMLQRRAGLIVNVASVGGRMGIAHEAAYCASKFALSGWSEVMAIDLAGTGVDVRLIQPGPIATDIWDRPGERHAVYNGPKEPPEIVARGILAAIERRRVRALPARYEGGGGLQAVRHRWLPRDGGKHDGRQDMRALLWGVDGDPWTPPPGHEDNPLVANLASSPMSLREVPDPPFVRPDWTVLRPRLAGICGSDSKMALLDFGDEGVDNAMAGLCSFPQVMGHEVVATVEALGPEAAGFEVGERVVLNPWLSCGPRGIDPPCAYCQEGQYSLCEHFQTGPLATGLHTGLSSDATGGWADLMPAHTSMLIPCPDDIADEEAVLADPFAVSLHAVINHPPPPGGKVLVYGVGCAWKHSDRNAAGALPRCGDRGHRPLRRAGFDGQGAWGVGRHGS